MACDRPRAWQTHREGFQETWWQAIQLLSHPARKLTQTRPLRTFVSIEFVSLYIGRHQAYGQHSDEDAKCGRKNCDDSKRGRNLHCHVYLNTADN